MDEPPADENGPKVDLFSGSHTEPFLNEEEWVAEGGPFREFVGEIPQTIKEKIVFLDLVLTDPHDGKPFAATYFRSQNLKEHYLNALRAMVSKEVTLGLSPALFDLKAMKKSLGHDWLYRKQRLNEASPAISATCTEPPGSIEPYFGKIDFEKEFLTKESLKEITIDRWLAEAKAKPIESVWAGYLAAIKKEFQPHVGDFVVFGAPVTLLPSRHSDGADEAKLGAVFGALSCGGQQGKKEDEGLELIARKCLHRAIIFCLRSFCAPPGLHSRLVQQHNQLESLLAPLSTLTEAFHKVQSEAQSLTAILSDPAESIFTFHHLLEPVFRTGNQVSVEGLEIVLKHDWVDPINDEEGWANAQRALAFVVLTVLGEEKPIKREGEGNASTSDHATYTRRALDRINTLVGKGEDAKSKLARMLLLVVEKQPVKGHASTEDEKFIDDLLTGEFESPQHCRYHAGKALNRVKQIVHTPFKGFGTLSKLHRSAVAFACYSSDPEKFADVSTGDAAFWTHVEHVSSPFPTRALLQFTMMSIRFLGATGKDVEFALNLGALSVSITSPSNKGFFFWNRSRSGAVSETRALEELRSSIVAAVRYGAGGTAKGDFFGIFQTMQKLAPSLSTKDDDDAEWRLVRQNDSLTKIPKTEAGREFEELVAKIVAYERKSDQALFRIESKTRVERDTDGQRKVKGVKTTIGFLWGREVAEQQAEVSGTPEASTSMVAEPDVGVDAETIEVMLFDHANNVANSKERKELWQAAFNRSDGSPRSNIQLVFRNQLSDILDASGELTSEFISCRAVVLHCNQDDRNSIVPKAGLRNILIIHASSQNDGDVYFADQGWYSAGDKPQTLEGTFSFDGLDEGAVQLKILTLAKQISNKVFPPPAEST